MAPNNTTFSNPPFPLCPFSTEFSFIFGFPFFPFWLDKIKHATKEWA